MEEAKKERTRRKKAMKAPPKFALPVRTLWDLATPEQRQKAQSSGMAILEYWTGYITKQEASKRLGVPPVRIWQLSQQATSGMLAGLLVQPKTRAKGVPMNPNEDPKALLKRIAELEEKVKRQDLLIAVLRSMPGCQEVGLKEMKEKDEDEKREAILKAARSSSRRIGPKKPKE
jgi:hypothetical protein